MLRHHLLIIMYFMMTLVLMAAGLIIPYGYVWIPEVGGNFEPYCTGGHWIYTEYGWTWFSDYSWGWAPFHYGSWFFDDRYGWLWIPGNDWAPAWLFGGIMITIMVGLRLVLIITIMKDTDLLIVIGILLILTILQENNVNNYVVNNTTIVNNNITIINNYNTYNNTTYNSGPKRGDVEKIIGKNIVPIEIKETDRPLQEKEMKSIRKMCRF